MKHPSIKSIILATIAAALLSLIQGTFVTLNLIICVAPVMMAVLYAWAGWFPAAVLAVGTVASVATTLPFLYGLSPLVSGLGAAAVLVLPGAASIWMLKRRMTFPRRMTGAILVQTAALVGLMAVIYLGYQVDLVDVFTSGLQDMLLMLPAEALNAIIQSFYMGGLLTQESVEAVTQGIVTIADLKAVFAQVADTMNYQMKLTMPAMLLASGILSGMFMTVLPSRMCVRRGDEPPVHHIPMHEWRLPARLIIMTLLCVLTGWVLYQMQMDGSEGVYVVTGNLCMMVFTIQGAAALLRRLRENGMGKGGRTALVILGLLMAQGMMMIIGLYSALMGRKGMISTWMRKRIEERRKEDDDE